MIHNASPFKESDVKALCGIRSSKKPEKGTLGYLGIGFKSTFKVTDCPEIYSNEFQFKFDRNAYVEFILFCHWVKQAAVQNSRFKLTSLSSLAEMQLTMKPNGTTGL